MSSRLRRAGLAFAAVVAVGAAGCGGSDDDKGAATTRTAVAAKAADLGAIKDYLLAHTQRLATDTATLRADTEAYYDLARAADFDYAKLWAEQQGVRGGADPDHPADRLSGANPAYEQMEGIVAGVPSLADFDVTSTPAPSAATPRTPCRSTSRCPRPRAREARQLHLPGGDGRPSAPTGLHREGREGGPRR